METEKFELGDIVVLKSSGPDMTITNLSPGGGDAVIARCAWFDMNSHPYTLSAQDIPTYALKKRPTRQ